MKGSRVFLGKFLTKVCLHVIPAQDPGIMHGPTEIPPHIAADESQFRDWRFCQKCQIYQGPLTAHCNDCKVCIDELDHHCPWMSKCVGKGNMKWFKVSQQCCLQQHAFIPTIDPLCF